MRLPSIVFVLGFALSLSAQQGTYEQLAKEASAAREAHDASRYLAALERMNALRPKHPTILVNLIAAYAMNGRADDAIAVGERLVRMKVYFNASRSDFDPLRSDPRFVRVTEALHALHDERVRGARVAFRIPEKGLITEGLAFDPKTHRYFVSSVRLGKIFQIEGAHASELVKGGTAGIHGLSGMGIDSPRRLLWACSTASPRVAEYKKSDPNDAAVVAFDLNDGRVVRRVGLATDGFCDDLTVAGDGTVYVSDSTGEVLALASGSVQLKTLVRRGVIRSPQGSVLSADGKILYVADYGGPIRAVDIRRGDAVPLRLPEDFQSMGIDGITRHGNRLIAVQNGIEPNRIVALTLSGDGLTVTDWKILEMNHPSIDEPTIGKVVGDVYYFVGASQGNKFDAGNPDASKLTDALVFAIPLADSVTFDKVFQRLRGLTGEWAGTLEWSGSRTGKGSVKATYQLTGNGSAVIENLFMGDADPSMTSVYHMDGADLRMTHYCGAHNQPRLKANPLSEADAVSFSMVDGTDLVAHPAHVEALEIRFLADDHIVVRFTFDAGGKKSVEHLDLRRVGHEASLPKR